jgi:prepilin-type N-terminal cleavage/methylation domain-containing protein
MKIPQVRMRAFTLIELLIVITIIGILAVALVPRITGGPAKARDATRKTDLQQIATALALYADDNAGDYPTLSGCFAVDLSDYMTKVPEDPQGTPCYEGRNTSNGFILIATLESNTASGDGVYHEDAWISADAPSASTTSDLFTAIDGYLCDTADCSDEAEDQLYIVGR